ncbi:hypothetical protein ACFVAE_10860 [Microbacterium sp. NPDC057659]|uniref:hypothetical protein n=1 Tax=Microbacterium sp. NPDC057659 TaxID=3346198 RepID=UPI00366F2942
MDAENDTSIEGRIARANRDAMQRQQKLFVRFAIVEGLVLALAVVAIYVLKLVDPDAGIFVILGVAVVGALVLSLLLIREVKRRQRELAEAKGETPGVW